MTSHSELSEAVVKETYRALKISCKNALQQGRVLGGLSVETRVVLMHDKLLRWLETRDDDEFISLAIDAVYALNTVLYKVYEGEDVDEGPSDEELDEANDEFDDELSPELKELAEAVTGGKDPVEEHQEKEDKKTEKKTTKRKAKKKAKKATKEE